MVNAHLEGAFSVITNLRMELFEALVIYAQASHLVQRVERPVGGGEGREDGAAQFERAGADLERGLEHGDGGGVARLGEQLLPDHGDDDEGRLVQLHGLQLTVGGLQGAWDNNLRLPVMEESSPRHASRYGVMLCYAIYQLLINHPTH